MNMLILISAILFKISFTLMIFGSSQQQLGSVLSKTPHSITISGRWRSLWADFICRSFWIDYGSCLNISLNQEFISIEIFARSSCLSKAVPIEITAWFSYLSMVVPIEIVTRLGLLFWVTLYFQKLLCCLVTLLSPTKQEGRHWWSSWLIVIFIYVKLFDFWS